MCINSKLMYRDGKYIEDKWNGKKGEEYNVKIFTKCGNCQQCINEKANDWVVRNFYESKKYKNEDICFITLTYKENPLFVIKKDLQNFIKRYRRRIEYHEKKKLRFFAKAEYGTKYGRPHCHILIYGHKPKDLKYFDINKKGNVYYDSELIKDLWKRGRISVQLFNPNEIPYLTLYETNKETTKREYIMSKQKADDLIKKLDKKIQDINLRKLMLNTLKTKIKKAEKERSNFLKIKEFNTWSTAIGWDIFYENYKKKNKYDFKEYIGDKCFYTPLSWVKKLANKGDKLAIQEMLRRTSEITANETLEEHKRKMNNQYETWKKNKIIEWAVRKEKTEF